MKKKIIKNADYDGQRITLNFKKRADKQNARGREETEGKMSKHTPGPWKFERFQGKRVISIFPAWKDGTSTGPTFCTLDISAKARRDIQWANARLIAAAPELLEALKYGRDTFGHDGGCLPELRPLIGVAPCARCMFDVAIAKAEGGKE